MEDPDGQQLMPLKSSDPVRGGEERHQLLDPLGRESAEGSLPELAASPTAEELPSSRSASPRGQPHDATFGLETKS